MYRVGMVVLMFSVALAHEGVVFNTAHKSVTITAAVLAQRSLQADLEFDTVTLKNVDLGTAGTFAILSKSGISTIPTSSITGNIGVSPIAAIGITGFSLVEDASHPQYSSSSQVVGKIYAADYAVPSPSEMTTAIGDMETAYTDAASRSVDRPDNLNPFCGQLTGETFEAGVYSWDRDMYFDGNVYLDGSDTDVFIFKTTGNVIAGERANVVLGGGVKTSNVIWQIAGFLEVNRGAHVEGIFLVKTSAVFKTRASINGRLLVQTAVTLDKATVVAPRA